MEPDDRKGFLYILIFAAIVYGVVRLCVLADPHPPFHRLNIEQNTPVFGLEKSKS